MFKKFDIKKKISELCCGKTLDIGFAQSPNYHLANCYGIDIQKVEKPDNYQEVKVVDLNSQPIPYEDNFFDSVVAGEIIEHVANPLKFLAECNRVLKNEGVLIITTPNPQYYWEIILNAFTKKFNITDEQHFYSFTRYNMRNLFRRTGFEMIKDFGNLLIIVKIHLKIWVPKYPILSGNIIYYGKKVANPKEFITIETTNREKYHVSSKIFS